MKGIKMMSGDVYPISEELFGKIQASGEVGGWVNVPNVGLINLASAEMIGELPKKAYWNGYELDKDERYFMRDGQRVYLETKHRKEVTYHGDPKYRLPRETKMLQKEVQQPERVLPEGL